MPFRFAVVCDLLDGLDRISTRDPPFLQKDAHRASRDVVESWFRTHRRMIDQEADGLALLSTLLPETRTDRVYGLQVKSLEKIVARVLALPNARRVDLERWRLPGAGDLADCVERVQKQAEMAPQVQANEVTVEEIDETLSIIASRNRFSSPDVRCAKAKRVQYDVNGLFATIFLRLQSRESKWFTRLVLKNYEPVIVPEQLVYSSYHNILPILLKVQAELPAALRLLRELVSGTQEDVASQRQAKMLDALDGIKPVIGTKIGRQPFFKSRGIKHSLYMARNRRMSVEKKYDGEYCQIHIDLSKTPDKQIKIFSKSGKDSTQDRAKLHRYAMTVLDWSPKVVKFLATDADGIQYRVIRKCLQLDNKNCQISHQCILEGEVLVYCDEKKKILEFHKIRQHISRSGTFLGIDKDSKTRASEHLMIVFFDVLLLDEAPILNLKHCERMKTLERLVYRIPGRVDLVERQVICFSRRSAAAELRKAFAQCISSHGEGLVLKPNDEPYFSYGENRDFQSCCIKMKKGYIAEFGDVGDFAVVGASYDASKTKGVPDLQWTEFYIGCLENKESVTRFKARPRFVVVATVTPNKEIIKSILRQSKQSDFRSLTCNSFDLRIERGVAGGNMPSKIFEVPFIFDIRCFGFVKEGNTGFWTMRFPQVSKVHFDRSYEDSIGFSELQEMAEMDRPVLDDDGNQEELQWTRRLEATDPHYASGSTSTQHTTTSPQSSRRESPLQIGKWQNFSIREDSVEENDAAGPSLSTSYNALLNNNNQSVESPVTPKRIDAPYTSSTTHSSKRQKLSPDGAWSSRGSARVSIGRSSISEAVSRESRKPLSDITNAFTTSENRGEDKNSNVEVNERAIDFARAECIENIVQSGPVQKILHPKRSNGSHMDTIIAALNKSSCKRAGADCCLIRCTFTLAPCVANMPWLTKNLLPSHGTTFMLDPKTWLDGLSWTLNSDKEEKRDRKIVLVESNRKNETMQALRKIEQLHLQKPNGKKEWVEIYDWRLLEYVDKLERGLDKRGSSWRCYWVGAV